MYNLNRKKIKTNEEEDSQNKKLYLPVEKSRKELIEQLYQSLLPSFENCNQKIMSDDEIMTKMDGNKNKFLLDKVLRMEERTYRRFLGHLSKYGEQMKMVLQAFQDTTNESFRQSVVNGTIPPEKVAKFKYKHMANPKEQIKLQKEKREYIRERDHFIHLFETYGYWEKDMEQKILQKQEDEKNHNTDDDNLTKSYVCGKCGSKEISYQQKQTRSMDEPMTVFFTCKKCTHMWRE